MIERLIEWAVRHRRAVVAFVVTLVGAGLWALATLRVDAFPELTNVQVQVIAEAPGLSPVEVERLVAFPIETALNGLPGVTEVRSLSRYGFASITVVFEDGTDIYFARNLIGQQLQNARGDLPEQVEVSLGPLSGAISEIYQYTVEGGGLDLMQLRTIQDRVIKPQLRSVPGVVEVNAFGGLVRQVQVTVLPDQLARYGLTLREVVTSVEGSRAVPAGGYLEHGEEQYILRGLGTPASLDDIRRTVIRSSPQGAPVRIQDVAEVGFGAELRQGAVSKDGRGEVVTAIVMALRGVNSRELVKRIRERVAEISRSLPPGVRITPYYDQTDLVNGTLRTVQSNLIEGGVLVIAILLLFLGNVRAALMVAATIPLSLLFAFLGLRWLGLSANLMSLGAIDFGMIVDGSVFMAEQFVRTVRVDDSGEASTSFLDRIARSAREVARPIAFGVLIIMLVYLPIVTLQGLEGRMFRPMAITVAMALFGSLLLALFYVPVAASWIFRKGVRESAYATALTRWLHRRYEPILGRTMRHPLVTLLIAFGLFAGSLILVPGLGTEFLPELDEGSLMIEALRDPSVSLTKSLDMQRDLERVVLRTPEVTTVVSQVGRPEVASDPMGVDRGEIFVMLKPRASWRSGVTKDRIQGEIEQHLKERVPGLSYRFTQPMAMRLEELISGVRADLAIKVFGDDPSENRRVAQRVAGVVQKVPGAFEVQVETTEGQGYLNVHVDRDAMARFGISLAEVQSALEAAVGARVVSKVVEGSYATDVVVQYPAALRGSPSAIGAIAVPAQGEARVPLSQIASVRLESGPVLLRRERAQRLVVVSANVRGRDLGGFAAEVQKAVGDRVKLSPGVFLEYGGQFENQRRAMARLRIVVPISLGIIVLMLHASLRSWPLALLVLTNLPFAATGGIVALYLRGLHVSVSAAIGFIALFGVSVLNGLVLLTTVQKEHGEGIPAGIAAVKGARERLRPILMTGLVASIGFIPVAMSHGTGAEVQRPLATVVIGGLITSTMLTLLVLPTLYAWIAGGSERRARWESEAALLIEGAGSSSRRFGEADADPGPQR